MSPSLAPIRISSTLALPVDAVTQKGAFLGSPSSGKTYAAKKTAEQKARCVTRDAISEATGYKRSTRDAYIQRLCLRRLAARTVNGNIEASRELF